MVKRLFNKVLSFKEALSRQNAWIDLRLYFATREWGFVYFLIPNFYNLNFSNLGCS